MVARRPPGVLGGDDGRDGMVYTEPTLIEVIVALGMPFMDAEAANREVVRLTVENMRLRAQIDAAGIREKMGVGGGG